MTTPGPADHDRASAAVAAWLGPRLRAWAGAAADPWAPLLERVETSTDSLTLFAGLRDVLAQRRQLAWLEFVSRPGQPWGNWAPDGLTFTVDPTPLAGDALLRRPDPIQVPDVLPMLSLLAGQETEPGSLQPQAVLGAPTPAALADSLLQLFDAADPALGSLTPRTRVRLFRHGRELAAPWVAAARFEEAHAAAEVIRNGLA